MLNLPKDEDGQGQLFNHAGQFEDGQGKIRAGKATITVALDGSGDAETIQEGLKMLPSTGGTVYIKEGIYHITSNIEINKSNTLVEGAGKATQIHINANATQIYINAVSYCTLRKIYIKTDVGNAPSIVVEAATHTTIQDLWIEDSADSGIYVMSSGEDFKIQNCTIIDSALYGIELDDCQRVQITNCYIYDAVQAIVGAYIKNSIVANNIIRTIANEAIDLIGAGCDGNIIIGNMFLSLSNDAVWIEDVGAVKNVIVGNSLIGYVIDDDGTGTVTSGNAT